MSYLKLKLIETEILDENYDIQPSFAIDPNTEIHDDQIQDFVITHLQAVREHALLHGYNVSLGAIAATVVPVASVSEADLETAVEFWDRMEDGKFGRE